MQILRNLFSDNVGWFWLYGSAIDIIDSKKNVINRFKKIGDPNTDAVVTGFQRSGNTYFSFLLGKCLPEISFVHHMHKFAIVKYAVKNEKPVFVLVRNPLDCIASSILKKKEEGNKGRHFYTRFGNDSNNLSGLRDQLLLDYISYFDKLVKNKDKLNVLHFENVIQYPEVVVNFISKTLKLNHEVSYDEIERYKLEYNQKKKKQGYYKPLEGGLPTEEKKEKKTEIKEQIQNSPYYQKSLTLFKEVEKLGAIQKW